MHILKKAILVFLLLNVSLVYANVWCKKKTDLLAIQNHTGYTLTVVIQNLRNKKGHVQLDLYKNQAEYEARMSDKKRRAYVYKTDAVNGKVTYMYRNVPGGVYGIALLDDENKNGEMDYGWFLPSEGYGFGDYWHTKWSAPTFDDFKFTLRSNKTVIMKVKYL